MVYSDILLKKYYCEYDEDNGNVNNDVNVDDDDDDDAEYHVESPLLSLCRLRQHFASLLHCNIIVNIIKFVLLADLTLLIYKIQNYQHDSSTIDIVVINECHHHNPGPGKLLMPPFPWRGRLNFNQIEFIIFNLI